MSKSFQYKNLALMVKIIRPKDLLLHIFTGIYHSSPDGWQPKQELEQYYSYLKMNMQTTEIPRLMVSNVKSPAIGAKVAALRADTMRQNLQLLNQEVDKMKQFNQKISDMLRQVGQNKITCQQTMNNLNAEIADLDNKVAVYEKNMTVNTAEQQYKDKIKSLQHEYVNTCKDRIKLSNQLNIKSLSKIHIQDKKSPANQLFRWALVCMYNEPETKYFWPNFKEQAFSNDKGLDFIERMGKVTASKQQHKVKTDYFLQHYNEIIAAPQLKNHQEDAAKIRQIAESFRRGYITSGSIKDNEHLIQKSKESTMERDEEFMRWKARSQALKDRIHINESYLRILNETEQKLTPKIQQYSQKIRTGETLKVEFETFDKWTPSINLGQENFQNHQSKGNCECSLF